MTERIALSSNELQCYDFAPEVRNHPYMHPVEDQYGRWLVPQMSQDEVIQRTLERIDNAVNSLLFIDGVTPSLFRNGVSTSSVIVPPDHALFAAAHWLAEREGALVAGDFIGLRDRSDLAELIAKSNRHLGTAVLSVAATGTLVGLGTYALIRRKSDEHESLSGVRDPLKRVLLVGGLASSMFAVAGYGLYALGVRRKTEHLIQDNRCIEGDVPLYELNVLPRSVAVAAKMQLNSYSENKHALWGSAHLLTSVVAQARNDLADPRDTMTNALLLEAQFIKNQQVEMSDTDKITNLAQFVIDMTTSMTLKAQTNEDQGIALIPLENNNGNTLQYHPRVAPEGLEKYNPVDRWGAIHTGAFMDYAHDVLARV